MYSRGEDRMEPVEEKAHSVGNYVKIIVCK